MMYLLDTDVLTHLHHGHARVVQHLRDLAPESVVATTIVTKLELLRGRSDHLLKAADGAQLLRAQTLLVATEELLSQTEVIPFDANAAAVFDRLRGTQGLRGIGRNDILVSSIALAHRATLVTRNRRHFRSVTGLQMENWVDD